MHLLFLDESGQPAERTFFALGGVALRDADWPLLREQWQATLGEHGWPPDREVKLHGIRTGEVPPALADGLPAATSTSCSSQRTPSGRVNASTAFVVRTPNEYRASSLSLRMRTRCSSDSPPDAGFRRTSPTSQPSGSASVTLRRPAATFTAAWSFS